MPIVAKDAIRSDSRAFLTRPYKARQPLTFHTSGTTGTPIATYWTADEYREAMALREARSAQWAGVSFEEPRATFSGRMVVPKAETTGALHRFNAAERQVYFSPFHLSSTTAPRYVEALHRHGVVWMTGYAVSFFLLARLILEQGLEVPPLRAVITTSEKVTPEMRETMEAAFGCPVFEEYSTVENAAFASACEHGRLHVSTDATLVEILRPDGSSCEPGEAGEIVATCLFRRLQPLIRFRVGDEARWASEPCPCGRHFPVIDEIIGRIEDVVIGPDGREMVRFHGVFVNIKGLREGQIVQKSLDRIQAIVVPTSDFSAETKAEITERVKARLGSGVAVEVICVDNIARTPAGKFQAVVSELSDETLQRARATTQ